MSLYAPIRGRVIASTWENRDLPVLEAIVEMMEDGTVAVTPAGIAERLGVD